MCARTATPSGPGRVTTNSGRRRAQRPGDVFQDRGTVVGDELGDGGGREGRGLAWRGKGTGRRGGMSPKRLRARHPVHELSGPPALGELERARRSPTGGQRGQHPRHAGALLAQVGGRHLVLAAREPERRAA